LGKEIETGIRQTGTNIYLPRTPGEWYIIRISRKMQQHRKIDGTGFKGEGEFSLVFYKEMKQRWWKKAYVNCCYRKERNRIAWWRTGIWKMKGIRKGKMPPTLQTAR
jgi:hypothetical protein